MLRPVLGVLGRVGNVLVLLAAGRSAAARAVLWTRKESFLTRSIRILVLLSAASIAAGACQDAAPPVTEPGGPKETSTPQRQAKGSDHEHDDGQENHGKQDLSPVLVPIIVEEGEVQGPNEVVIPVGTPVRIDVRADAADEVHVHGYDQSADVGPGKTTSLELTADLPGVFEVRLEESDLLLFELRVEGP
jgi:hypothetical protein